MKKQNLGSRLLMAVVTLAVIAYFGVGVFRYVEDPLSTTLAYTYQLSEGVDVTGYVVRQESILPDEDAGVLRLTRGEGERVSKGGTVAAVYADHASLERQSEVDELTTHIEQLQYARDAALADEVSIKLDSQIFQCVLDYRADLTDGRLREAETHGTKLRSLILKRDYNDTGGGELDAQIAELEAQLKEKKSQVSASVRRVAAPASGLWSAVVDGYETVLTPQSVAAMTPSQLSSLQADAAVRSNTGKMVLGDKWYFAATLSQAEAESLRKEESRGVSLSLRFAKEAERDLPVTISSISAVENGRCVVVLEGNTFLQELTMLRQQRARIITGSVEGIRVPKEALRAEKTTQTQEGGTVKSDGTGVYCVVGMEARFKPVEVVYSGESFAIVRANAPADKERIRLRPGDEVIVAARGLYDGKVVG